MRITIPSQSLQLVIQRVQVATLDRKMAYIALYAEKNNSSNENVGQLSVFASESLMDVYAYAKCDIQSYGQCCVGSRLFVDMTRQLPRGEVGLSVEGAYLVVRMFGDTQFEVKIPHIPEYQWISEPKIKQEKTAKLPSAQMSYTIDQVFSCIGGTETTSSYEYGDIGYLHQVEQGKLRLVGTDSTSLSCCDMSVDIQDGFLSKGLCLSRKTLSVFSRVCEQGMESVIMSVSGDETMCSVEIPGYKVYLRVSFSAFPKYAAILQVVSGVSVKVSREMLLGVIRRIILISSTQKTNKIVRVTIHENELKLSAAGDESSGEEIIRMGESVQKSVSFGLNGEYILQVLTHLCTPSVTFSCVGANHPFRITADGELQGCVSRHVTAPIKEPSSGT